MKYVVYSTNQVPAYAFMAPIVAKCWQTRTEFKPVCLLTQTREHWDTPSGRILIEMLDRFDVKKHYIGIIKEPYRTSVQAQAARQHMPLLHCYLPGDYAMMADVDMVPINGEWYSRVDWKMPVHVRHASAWQYRWHTTPYIGMGVAAWREVMGYEPGGEIGPVLEKNLDLDLTPERDTMAEWFFDEFLWNSRLKVSRFWPGGCQFIERQIGKDRIDRGRWPNNFNNVPNCIDAHVLRPVYSDENWPRSQPLLERLIPNSMEEICQYRKRYVSAVS